MEIATRLAYRLCSLHQFLSASLAVSNIFFCGGALFLISPNTDHYIHVSSLRKINDCISNYSIYVHLIHFILNDNQTEINITC